MEWICEIELDLSCAFAGFNAYYHAWGLVTAFVLDACVGHRTVDLRRLSLHMGWGSASKSSIRIIEMVWDLGSLEQSLLYNDVGAGSLSGIFLLLSYFTFSE